MVGGQVVRERIEWDRQYIAAMVPDKDLPLQYSSGEPHEH